MPVVSTIIEDIQKFWRNGTRSLLIAFIGFLAVCAISISLTVTAYFVTRHNEFSPLHNEVPQIVLTKSVPVGGVVKVQAVKCNDSSHAFSTDGETNVRNVQNGDLYQLRKGTGVRDPGCFTRIFENKLTDDIPPGRYRMEGFDLAVSDSGQVQREPHYSEDFEIVEGLR